MILSKTQSAVREMMRDFARGKLRLRPDIEGVSDIQRMVIARTLVQ